MTEYDRDVLTGRLALMRGRLAEIDKTLPSVAVAFPRQELESERAMLVALIGDLERAVSPEGIAAAEAVARRKRDWLIAREKSEVASAFATADRFEAAGDHRQAKVHRLSAWDCHKRLAEQVPPWSRAA